MKGSIVFRIVVMLLIAYFSLPKFVNACSVCFGDPDSLHTKGMSMAILFLLVITTGVLGSFATFFIYLMRRAKRMNAELEMTDDECLTRSDEHAPKIKS